ncbi:MAG: FAD-binding protein [Polyangiales bacterium]
MESKSKAPAAAAPPLVEKNPDAARWDDVADVIVVGFGGAGACAALEAKDQGAKVLVLERYQGGGATTLSGGVVYAGGGTNVQKQAGVEDSAAAMFEYLKLETKGVVSEETLRDFVDSSVTTLDWLQSKGVPFEGSLCPYKTSYPTDDYYLYYSGNEGFSPFKDAAKPAPRGHRAKGEGLPGASFYEPLRRTAERSGVDVRYEARVERLITDEKGRVVGVEYHQIPEGPIAVAVRAMMKTALALRNYQPSASRKIYERIFEIERTKAVVRRARATKGVILSAGGFIFNRDMVEQYAPKYRKGMPLGSIADSGSGIRLGESVGGATDLMSRVSAWRFINPPEAWTRGVVVNKKGERYVNEMLYGAAIGEAMVEHNEGHAYIILDDEMKKEAREQCKPGRAQWFQRAPALLNLWFNRKEGRTIEELAAKSRIPADQLRKTVDEYNRIVDSGNDPMGKPKSQLHKIAKPPFHAIDAGIASKRFPCPTLTLGGLVVDEKTGNVKRADGSRVEGLYAAGRTAVGVCSRQYVSGLSIADCVYSGRRAGRVAAKS